MGNRRLDPRWRQFSLAYDLGLCLRQMRYSRALGIALATTLARGRAGGDVRFESGETGGTWALVIRIPAVLPEVRERP